MKKTQRRSFSGWILKAFVKLVLLLVCLTLFQVVALKYVNPPFTVNMVWERLRHELFDAPYVIPAYEWQSLSAISPHLQQAVIASEDQRFLTHHGFDFEEIKIVLKNMRENKRFRGASTITMQAARSVFLPATRNPLRKLAEAWYTVLIELVWDKPRILELYLNTVDWGTGIVGAQAGARVYFAKNADNLTPEQAALMAAILPSPHKWSAKDPGPHVKNRQKHILQTMPAMPIL
ncbi:MAG: monofunctional biosynthetic peptidoglycan transglycosylase [Desulfotignum sp.]|nr:monofunctional biosynthetic peptidoglycan transglycosylase [Desulfobacteraceae bacterium]